MTTPQTTGLSTKLKVNGKAVILKSVQGSTDGQPAATYSASSAGQSKLKAE
jgi:hypothetical protein